MLKKWIALALSIVILLSVLPAPALADPTDPSAAATETTVAPSETTTDSATTEQPAPPAEGETTEEPKEEEEEPKPKLAPLSAAQAAIPTNKLPTKAARIARLRYYIQFDHQNALEQEDRESLYGFCGLLASYQLFYRGINTWRRCSDGKDYFDTYSNMRMTDAGYTIRSYNALKDPIPEATTPQAPAQTTPPANTTVPAETTAPAETVPPSETTAPPASTDTPADTETVTPPETPAEPTTPPEPEKYTIAQILNQVTNYGSKEVYNLLVCFDRTDTAAGSIYGHVVFVYGIIDGTVYFTEGGDMFGVKAGEPMECTISQFSASYATWTDFEGIIVFGNKDYLDNCQVYASNMFVTCTEDVALLPLPDQVEDTAIQRIAAKGERLQVTAVYQNRDGFYYYEIFDGSVALYAPYQSMKPLLYLQEPYALEEPKLPQVLKPKQDMRLDGTLTTGNYIGDLTIRILDSQGAVVQEFTDTVNDSRYDLYDWDLNKALDFAQLPEGLYRLQVETRAYNWYMHGDNLAKRLHRATVLDQYFAVGEATPIPAPVEEPPVETVKDGWFYENGTWYCFNQGTPCTGWLLDGGIRYYLQPDGSVSTDWTLVDNQLKLFTATGAMRTGWVNTKTGRKYLYADGSAATGWLRLDGEYCYFNPLGIWQENYMRTTMNRMAQLDMTPAVVGQVAQEE